MEEANKLEELRGSVVRILAQIEQVPQEAKSQINELCGKYEQLLEELDDVIRNRGMNINFARRYGIEPKEINGKIDHDYTMGMDQQLALISKVINQAKASKQQEMEEVKIAENKQTAKEIHEIVADGKQDDKCVQDAIEQVKEAIMNSKTNVLRILGMERLPEALQDRFVIRVIEIVKEADEKALEIKESLAQEREAITSKIDGICEEYMDLADKQEENSFRDRMAVDIPLQEQHEFAEKWKAENEEREYEPQQNEMELPGDIL